MPDAEQAPAILLIHEWWGLNDLIRSVAVEFANLGYVALAVDLYGKPAATDPDGAREADKLRALKSPVLGHFATKYARINGEMVGGFERAMKQAGRGRQLDVHWYDAGHAFANPTSSSYDEPDAVLSWERPWRFCAPI